VELIYWHLASQKSQYSRDLFVFWDKMCLNDGQDWEEGFLHGITNSTVIILLISNKVIEGICAKATQGQDNVLVEYECALLQNRKHGTPVIPVFVAEKDPLSGDFIQLDFGKAMRTLPDAPHSRKSRASDMIKDLSDSIPPRKLEFLQSVKTTIDDIFHMQGVFMSKRGADLDDLNALAKRATAAVQKHL